jgi:tetratricopeptide (TPR) repeat protein
MKFRLVLTVLFLSLAAAAPALADNKVQARESFASGTSHYDLAEYQAALTDFKAAYRNYPDPTFLFNIAQCHRQLGQNEEAARFYRTFLIKVPAAPNQKEVRAMIVKLEKMSADERTARSSQPTGTMGQSPPQTTTTEPAPPPAVTTPPAVTLTPAPTAIVATAPPERPRPLYKRWWLWTAVGGAVAIGLGVGLGVGLSHASNASANSSFGTVHPF